ncbi:hypothetical protein CWI38_0007p0100 [Hamiltosporidium tvaerminnensis]|uniref:Uncharacterized protein n=2 Tax=Hamiltosporidium TaxID=1176354 RepID=A0A4Q9M2L9_9MICR|nr:hypothetical protein CWI38_0007p0100 [Hamiltosporidium tvaerminnensis]
MRNLLEVFFFLNVIPLLWLLSHFNCTSVENNEHSRCHSSNTITASTSERYTQDILVEQPCSLRVSMDLENQVVDDDCVEVLTESENGVIILSSSDDENDNAINATCKNASICNEIQTTNKQIKRIYPYCTDEIHPSKKKFSESSRKDNCSLPLRNSKCKEIPKQDVSCINEYRFTEKDYEDNPSLGYYSYEEKGAPVAMLRSEKQLQSTYSCSHTNAARNETSIESKITKKSKSLSSIETLKETILLLSEPEKYGHKLKDSSLKEKYLEFIIDTKGKTYTLFNDSEDNMIGFTDIRTFITSDFYINIDLMQENLTYYFIFINNVAKNEQKYWEKLEDETDKLRQLTDEIINCIEKLNFFKNSCLWIILLKFVQSLSYIPVNEIYKKNRFGESESTLSEEYKTFNIYEGDEKILDDIKKSYETFDVIAKYIFLRTKIFSESTQMLNFIGKCLKFNNMDFHISLGINLDLDRVITDSIFRLSPDVIKLFVLQIEKQNFLDLDDEEFLPSVSFFFECIFEGLVDLKSEDITDFKHICKGIILAYLDFFENEAQQSDFSDCKNITFLRLYDLKDTDPKYIELTKMMKFAEALCVFYNYYIKVGLNNIKIKPIKSRKTCDVSDSSRWLKRGNIGPRNEAVFCYIQDRNVLWGADGVCQHCGKSGKTVDHLATRCEKMLGHDYPRRHNEVVRCLHLLLLDRYKFKSSKRIRSHSVQEILDNEYVEIRVDTRIKTDVKIRNNRPDIFILDKKKNKITLIKVGITSTDSLQIVETEKLRKYDLLANDLGLIYKCMMNWDGIVTKYHKSHLKRLEIPMNKKVETISFDRRRGLESGLNAEESWERASMGVIMRAEMHEEPTAPLKEEKREEDGVKILKPKNNTPLISQGGTTLEEPTNNINEESDLEEETIVVKEVEENI